MESNVEDELSPEEARSVWNEEAAKLGAGDDPAPDALATAPEIPPQIEAEPQVQEPAHNEDPLAGVPEAVRAKLAQIDQLAEANAQLLHHVKTAEGRVAAMQREFQLGRAAQQTVAPQEAPSQGQMTAAVKNPEKWEQLKQDFPEWADAMEEYVTSKLGASRPQHANLDPKVVEAYVQQQVAQSRAEMSRALEEARIEGRYEDWRETVNTPEFAQWFSVQADDVKALAGSEAAKDAIRMLGMYHEAKKRPAADIKQERGARLAAAATTRPGQTPPPLTLGDMSAAELWNYEAAKREKLKAQRGY